jgi:hypothetical protein
MKNIDKKTLTTKKSEIRNDDFLFTPENIIENIDKVGPWSSYGLACIALAKYFPKEYNDRTGKCPDIYREIKLIEKLGCSTWHDVIVKFQTEIGYNAPNGFNPKFVNDR